MGGTSGGEDPVLRECGNRGPRRPELGDFPLADVSAQTAGLTTIQTSLPSLERGYRKVAPFQL